jgi:hypothetical protein
MATPWSNGFRPASGQIWVVEPVRVTEVFVWHQFKKVSCGTELNVVQEGGWGKS